DDLPRRVAQLTADALTEQFALPENHIGWKAPNDLVAASATGHAGAKVGGILIDARSTSSSVTHLVVGIGANLTGGAFRTSDGRKAVAIDALQARGAWIDPDAPRLARSIAGALHRLLLAGT
ncbi:MAG: hypothetical protein JWN72_1398, partial [Thermoleophilia bacterium]|nr:hypothetical protein [Thermoleophilia bacterium]